jgi:membrane-bound acyltransferase YfiQ involved in biofilm formation
MKDKLTIADVIWFFIGAGSFLLFALVTVIMVIVFLLLGEGTEKLVIVPVVIVLWGIWAGFYMGIKHLRSRP